MIDKVDSDIINTIPTPHSTNHHSASMNYQSANIGYHGFKATSKPKFHHFPSYINTNDYEIV